MELLKFHVEVTSDEAGYPTGTFCIQQRFPAKGAGVKEAVRRAVGIAIDIVQPHRVPTPGVPDHTHEPGPKHRWNGGGAATTDNDGKEAVAIMIGGRQDNLTTSPTDIPQYGAPQTDTGLLYQGDVPTEGRKVSPTLGKAGKIGRDNARAGVGSFPEAVKALALTAKDPGMPRGDPGVWKAKRKSTDIMRTPKESLPKAKEALRAGDPKVPSSVPRTTNIEPKWDRQHARAILNLGPKRDRSTARDEMDG